MAHPFAKNKEEDVGKARAKNFTKGLKSGGSAKGCYAEGGYVAQNKVDDAEDSKPEGRKSGGRLDKFARGGRAKSKGNNTKINIVVAPKGPHPADGAAPPALGAPPMAGGPPPPPGGPLGGPPPGLGGPPGMPPGLGGPKPPGMMKRGGVVKKYASGGFIKMKAGADTGPGRLEKAKKYKARG